MSLVALHGLPNDKIVRCLLKPKQHSVAFNRERLVDPQVWHTQMALLKSGGGRGLLEEGNLVIPDLEY